MKVRPEIYIVVENTTGKQLIRTRNAEKLSRLIESVLNETILGAEIRNALIHKKSKCYHFGHSVKNSKTFWLYTIRIEEPKTNRQ